MLKRVLIVGSCLLPLGLPILDVSAGRAQNNLPLLEVPTATSAAALSDLQYRKVSTDFDSVVEPSEMEPASQDRTEFSAIDQTKRIDSFRSQPIYTEVQPNRAIQTQTDPQRLTVVAPTTRPTTRP